MQDEARTAKEQEDLARYKSGEMSRFNAAVLELL